MLVSILVLVLVSVPSPRASSVASQQSSQLIADVEDTERGLRNVKFKETVFMEGSPSAGGAALKAVRLLRGSPEPNASNPAACIKTAVDENGRCEEGGAALLKFLRTSPALHLSRDRRILWFDRAQGVQNRGTGWEAGERVAGVASVDWSLTNTKQCALVDFLVHKGRVAWDVNIRQLCLPGALSRSLARSLGLSLSLCLSETRRRKAVSWGVSVRVVAWGACHKTGV